MFKLSIDAGHGINTAGKRCLKKLDPKETREWVLNERIVSKVIAILGEYDGILINRTSDPTGKKDVTLRDRYMGSNNFGSDLFISVHHNAGAWGSTAGGITVHTYTDKHEWRKDLYEKLIQHTGLAGNRRSPLCVDKFSVLKYTNCPAVLIECGFMDSATDVPIILTSAYADKVAIAIVEFIVEYSGIFDTYKPEKPVTPDSYYQDIHWVQYKLGLPFSYSFDEATAWKVTEHFKAKGWQMDYTEPKYYVGKGTVTSLYYL